MEVNGKELNVDDLINDLNTDDVIKPRKNGIYLSDRDNMTLLRYGINYNQFNSLSSLIFEIEGILNVDSDATDLEDISLRLSEMNYYNNTNK